MASVATEPWQTRLAVQALGISKPQESSTMRDETLRVRPTRTGRTEPQSSANIDQKFFRVLDAEQLLVNPQHNQ